MIQPWRYFIQNELLSRIYFLCLVLSIESSTHQTTCVFFFILLRSLICSYNTLMILAHTSKMLLVYWNWTSYGAHFKTNSKQLVQPYSVFKASIHWCKFFSCKWCKFHILLFLATHDRWNFQCKLFWTHRPWVKDYLHSHDLLCDRRFTCVLL